MRAYVGRCNICLALKAVKYKLYRDLQLLLVSTHEWKNWSIDFVTSLPVSTNFKGETYDSILFIVNWLKKIVYYESIKVIIDTLGLVKGIINMVVLYHNLFNTIVSNQGSVFMCKFWFFLSYFLGIKQKLSIIFYTQTNGQTKK